MEKLEKPNYRGRREGGGGVWTKACVGWNFFQNVITAGGRGGRGGGGGGYTVSESVSN